MSIVDKLAQFRFFACFLCFFCLTAQAQNWQDKVSAQICQQWYDISSAQQECHVSFPGLSQEYQLPDCELSPQVKVSRALNPGRNGLELTCQQPRWQQNLAMQLHIYDEIAVLATPINIGQTLSADDVSMIRHDLSTVSGDFFTEKSLVVGQVLKRNIRTGTVLNSSLLEAPILINKGDLVTIRIQRSTISLETQGTALSKGTLGQRIRVRNNQSNKIVAARVIKAGLVEVK